jgi:myo-inositol catabolism protein IolC
MHDPAELGPLLDVLREAYSAMSRATDQPGSKTLTTEIVGSDLGRNLAVWPEPNTRATHTVIVTGELAPSF